MHPSIGKLYVVATPIGNLSDLSQRAKEVLKNVSWIAAEDTRHSGALLTTIGVSSNLLSYHDHNEHHRIPELIAKLQAGESGALISDAGTPLVSDPGYLLVKSAHEHSIKVVPIPGACAAIAALSASGLPTDRFFFEGFLPVKSKSCENRLAQLRELPHTLVFYEAPHRIHATITHLVASLGGDRQATIAREITKKFESIRLNTLAELLNLLELQEIPAKGEFVIIVEGKKPSDAPEENQEIVRILQTLLAEMSLKQAVQITVKLTGRAKNTIYDLATELKKQSAE